MKRLIVFMIMMIAVYGFAEDSAVTETAIPVKKCSPATAERAALNVVVGTISCTAAACRESVSTDKSKTETGALAQALSGNGGVEGLGNGVKSMLESALSATGCFNVVDTGKLSKLQSLAAVTGQEVKIPKIDLYVDASITYADITKSGGALAGGKVPVLSMVSKTNEAAGIVLDVAVLNPATAEIRAKKNFKTDSSKSSWTFGSGGDKAAEPAGVWSLSSSPALDAAVRDAVFSATDYMVETLAADRIQPKADVSNTAAPAAQAATPAAGQ